MKVAIDISQIVYGTGVSTYTKNLIENLITLFPEDEYVLFAGVLRQRRQIEALTKRLSVTKRYYPLPPSFLDLIWNSFHILPIESLTGKVDLIHTSDWAEPPSKIPKITTVHDLVAFKYPQTTTDAVKSAHRKRLAWVNRESSQIIAVSNSTKNDLVDLMKIDEEKIVVVPEGVEPFFKPQPPFLVDDIKRKYHIKANYLFTLGTLEPRKNLKSVIEAFHLIQKKQPELNLVISGKAGWDKDLVKTDAGVIWTGYVPEADLPALFTGCEAYVLPSLYEGFSLTHLEAMACGAVVVGSDRSSMPEVIGQAGILVNPDSIESIAEGIIRALGSKSSLSAKAQKRAALFTWEETAKATRNVYQSVIEHAHRN